MKSKKLLLLLICILTGSQALPQYITWGKTRLTPVQVYMSPVQMDGRSTIRVVKDSAVKKDDEATFVKIEGTDFRDGVLEVKVLSRLLSSAPAHARGFIGLAFRIRDDNSRFECIYIRPTNGRADQQLRRNRSVQYFSFPDFKFDRLRKEAPGEYESYADMGLNEWITLRIEVKGTQAKLFLNQNREPSLIVNDLKLGADSHGAVGLFVDIGTEGYFADLRILPQY